MTTPETTTRIVDEALAAGAPLAADPDARTLQELALALADLAPEAPASLEQELERLVAAGFPRRRRAARAWDAVRSRVGVGFGSLGRNRLQALGAAAAVATVVVAVAVIAPSGDQPVDDPGSTPSVEEDEAPTAARSGEAGGSAGAEPAPRVAAPDDLTTLPPVPPPPGDDGIEPGARERLVERTATLELGIPEDELSDAGQDVFRIARRHRGFVVSSELTTGEDADAGGSYVLRVPAGRLRRALADLSGLGTVLELSESGEDTTAPFAALEDRLDMVRAERRGLLRRLERAETPRFIRRLRQRLEALSIEIRGLREQIEAARERADLAAIELTLEPVAGDGREGHWYDGPLDALEDSGLFVLKMLAFALPLGLLAAGLAMLAIRVRRRRRERALSD